MICTFIGHRNTPNTIEPILRNEIIRLIENGKIDKFYLGTHGNFDYLVLNILRQLKKTYNITYNVVLPYIPKADDRFSKYENTILPAGFETTPPKFAIINRNHWMIENCDFLICYVTQDITNAYDFMKLARKKQKKIINLADRTSI